MLAFTHMQTHLNELKIKNGLGGILIYSLCLGCHPDPNNSVESFYYSLHGFKNTAKAAMVSKSSNELQRAKSSFTFIVYTCSILQINNYWSPMT